MDSSPGSAYGSASNDAGSIPGDVTLGLGSGQKADLGRSDLEPGVPNNGSAFRLLSKEWLDWSVTDKRDRP